MSLLSPEERPSASSIIFCVGVALLVGSVGVFIVNALQDVLQNGL